VASPRLEEFGLTRRHPGEHDFIKGPPTADANGTVYLFGKFVDVEPKAGGGDYLNIDQDSQIAVMRTPAES
jgi:hypothetical protein